MITATQSNGRTSAQPVIGYPTEWEVIDPIKASHYIEKYNVNNRPKSTRLIQGYARAMKRGEWEPNGDTIRFSNTDVLLNGQHTLLAIVESNTTQVCLVVRGLPDRTFKTMDCGKRRTQGDTLSHSGYKNANQVAATIRLLWAYEVTRSTVISQERRLTNEQVVKVAAAIPELPECVTEYEGRFGWKRVITNSIGSAIWFTTRATGDTRERFFAVLFGDEGATRKNPAVALRERFLAETTRRTRNDVSVALAFKAWNLFYAGREIGCLKMSENEEFPRINGYGDELTATFPEWVE